ncbi:MAG: peptidoglycan-binding protein [Candidatus Magnetoglobus multicellularis str. Araruama]|uniref:Peptidoglycan-binding protein n=1 Tax=Candidatus Magnetoglobus multicellularis str. Araruama TaxID=890399 RepID=A0A1V1P9F7_9BACT|nr:MAG: peptidoglycan-binding protein [Candidatus Magnetoglobus multicellularis str. Araruama]
MIQKRLGLCVLLGFLIFSVGCARLLNIGTTEPSDEIYEKDIVTNQAISQPAPVVQDDNLLQQQQIQIQRLRSALEKKEMTIQEYKKELEIVTLKVKEGAANQGLQASAAQLPPGAKPGECYARVYISPKYKTISKRIMVQPASEEVKIIPAKYEWAEKQVMIDEASVEYKEIPAVYKWVTEKILVKEAHTIWKKGRGNIEKIDNATGEVMCMVHVPPTYKTVKKRIMVSPARIEEINKPAKYKTIKYKKMVQPPKKNVVPVPAQYKTITKKVKVAEGKMIWQRTMCETNIDRNVVLKIQQFLRKDRYNPGPVDGILGPQTRRALKSFQRDKGLAIGSITYETLKYMKIQVDKKK